MNTLTEIITANRAGTALSLPSICSAHRDVLRASMLMPEASERPLLIEATSNQVNQYGGYTGMNAADFVSYIHDIASECRFPTDRLILGGDHLGPQAWKHLDATNAMEKAHVLVDSYAKAGFSKIHLDCSEGCKGEPAHLGDEEVAARAAALAETCERAAPDNETLTYIVGTEVPVPGGARNDHQGILPTRPESAIATYQTHMACFSEASAARIAGLVVQPGIEFGAETVDHLPAVDTSGLRAALDAMPSVTYEAHSTDYQRVDAYPRLAQMGFAIHKVGPALTFAYRKALYGLDAIRAVLDPASTRLSDLMEREMTDDPSAWSGHYKGSEHTLGVLRHFSYSDRIRYYWTKPGAISAVAELFDGLSNRHLPDPLVLQYFDEAAYWRAETLPGHLQRADRLMLATVQQALAPYYFKVTT